MSPKLTKKELISLVAKDADLNQKSAGKIVNALFTQIRNSLSNDNRVVIKGLGSFSTVLRKSRIGVNPQTGKTMTIPENKKPKFTAGKEMAQEVNRFRPLSEKRKLKRRNFIIDMQIIERKDFKEGSDELPELGDLADITVEGIMLVSERPIEESKLYELRVVLPPEVVEEFIEDRYIDFDARAIRCKDTIHECLYVTGFKIEKLSDSDKLKIRNLINRYAV